MENPFKDIARNKKVPEYIRKRVIDDIALIKLSIDLFDLAAVKYPDSIIDFVSALHANKPRKQKDKDNS